jgi:hypothetical protein
MPALGLVFTFNTSAATTDRRAASCLMAAAL